MTQPNNSAHSTPAAPLMQHKRKAPSSTPTTSLYDRLFKRSRTTVKMSDATPAEKSAADETKKKPNASLETSRKKEIKSRLRAEAGREIRPLAVGTLAMMASALANQGESVLPLL